MPIGPPPPTRSPLLEPDGSLNTDWLNWFFSLAGRVDASPQALSPIHLVNQQAAIVARPFTLGVVGAAVYRVTWYVRVTQAASVSSALQVRVDFTDGGVPCFNQGDPVVGNTTASGESNECYVRADAVTAVTFSMSYASVGGVPMQFRLDMAIEKIN